MRFQQLKRDPNNIVRKRLVKSKKNWVVLSSLSIAGGLLFLSAPTYIAKADTTTETQSVTTTLTAKAAESSNSGTSTAANSETKPTATDSTSTEKQAASTVTTPTVTDGATSEKAESTTDTKTPATDAETSDTTANKATTTEETSTTEQTAPVADSTVKTTAETVPVDPQAVETADAGNVTTTKTDDTKAVEDTKIADDTTPVKTDTTVKTDTDVPTTSTTDSTTKDSGTTDPGTTDSVTADKDVTDADATKIADETVQTPVATSLLMANLAESKLQLAKMGVMAESLDLTPETEVLADGNIAEGVQGTAPWHIDAKGILHIGDSTKTTAFENNTATTTRQVSSESSSTSTSTETPTSPWDNYANNINTITFEGTVQGAKDMSYMFANLGNLTTINNIDNLDTNGVTDSSGDSTPTTNAKGMFMNDAKLTDIISARTPDGKASTSHTAGDYDLTNMHFGSLTDTSDMFLNNQSVKTITFPNTVDTKGNTLTHVSNFNYMFKNDISLTNVVMKNWQFINYGKTMLGMFQNDYNLVALDLTSWLMPSGIETGDSSLGQGMFDGTNLQSIKLSNYNKFKSYTALPSSSSNGMAQSDDGSTVTSGGKTFATIPGNTNYTYDLSTITANSGSGTTFVANTAADKAKPTTATMEIQTNMGVKTVSVSGTLYSAVTVDTPSESGFTADLPKVVGTITNSTTATTSNYITYSANASTSSVSTSKGSQSIDIPSGVVGTTSDPIDLPTVDGYETPQVKVEYTKDGNIITDVNGNVIDAANPIQYVGKTVDVVTPTLKDNSETLKVTTSTDTDTALTTAKVGDKVVVTLPTVTGYTPHDANGNEVTNPTITGTIDADGKFVPDSGQVDPTGISYTGNTVDTNSTTVKTPSGQTQISMTTVGDPKTALTTGTVGDKVIITLPTVAGYTPQDSNDNPISYVITGTIDADGNFHPDTDQINPSDVHYVGDTVDTKTTSVTTPTGSETLNITTKAAPDTALTSGKIGTKVIVTLPTITGYKAYDADGNEVKDTTITGTIGLGGVFVPDSGQPDPTKVNYIGDSKDTPAVNFTTPGKTDPTTALIYKSGDTSKTPVTSTKVGDKVTLEVPQTGGYTTQDSTGKTVTEITGTIDVNGDFVPDSNQVNPNDITYIGDKKDAPTVTFTTPGKGITTAPIYESTDTKTPVSTTKVGDKVTLEVPQTDGYTTQDSKGNIVTEITGTINAKGDFVPDEGQVKPSDLTYVGDNVDTKNTAVTLPSGPSTLQISSSDTSHTPVTNGNVGDKVVVTLPTVAGYKVYDADGNEVKDTTITGTIGLGGVFVPDENQPDPTKVNYVGDSKDTPVITFTTPGKTDPTTALIYESTDTKTPVSTTKVGDKVTLKVPQTDGYTTQDSKGNIVTEITGTINAKGDFVPDEGQVKPSDLTYVGNDKKTPTVTFNTPGKDPTTAPIYESSDDSKTPVTSAKVGDKVTLEVPQTGGYTTQDNNGNTITKITGTIDADGNFKPDDSSIDVNKISYIGNPVSSGTATVKATQNGTTDLPDFTVSNLTGKVGDTIDVQVPSKTGYNSPATVKGTILPDGKTVQVNETVNYEGLKYNDSVATVKTNNHGNQQVQHVAGQVGESVTVDVPHIEGYTPDKTTVTGIMDENGEVKPDETVNYSPNTITAGTATIKTNKGDLPVDGLTGTVDDKSGVTIKVPHVDGYTPDRDTITGTMNPDGSVTPDESVNYTPNKVSDAKTTIKTNKGDLPVDGLTGTVDDKGGVTIKVPHIEGYTPDKESITGTMNPDGTVTPDEPITYTGNPVENKTVNIPGIKDGQSTPQTVTGLSGKVGDTITVDVPQIPGYKADKTTVQATINPDGSITTTESVNYTKIPSHTNIVEPVVDPGKGNTTVEKKPLNVSTYYNKPNVQIYALDDKSAMQSLGERELPNGTNWYSDQMVNIDGVNYYRVATNEYVKATQVYPYESVELTIETHDLEDKPLYDAAGQLVETRKLAAISDWFTDRLITINGEKYYRVSSGEFVKASQVNPYKEVHANIQTNSTTEYKQLYNSRGVAIPGKVVAANSVWYTDRVVYINGVKYYRVATDEYIKADDVDTNIDVNITEL